MTRAEAVRYSMLRDKFYRDRCIVGYELAEYALLYFAARGNDASLRAYREVDWAQVGNLQRSWDAPCQ